MWTDKSAGHAFRVLVVLVTALPAWAGGSEPSTAPKDAPSSSPPVWEFRGLVPGTTPEAALIADPRWGEPVARTTSENALEVLRYKVAKHDVDVSVRDGIVQSIDIALPAGTTLDKVVHSFGLKDPLPDGPLPQPARIGPAVSDDLQPRQFACGRFVVFVVPDPDSPTARLMRYYGPDTVVEHPYLAVIWFRGYEALLDDMVWLGELSGSASFAGDVKRLFKDSPLAQTLSSPDYAQRPWIVGVSRSESGPVFTVFLPTSDIGSFLRQAGPGVASLNEPSPGNLQFYLPFTGFDWYATQYHARWAAVSHQPLADQALVDDPEQLTSDYSSGCDLAARVYVAKIPVDIRKQWLVQIAGGLQAALANTRPQDPTAPAEQLALNDAMFRQNLAGLVQLFASVDHATARWSLDRETKTAQLELVVTPKSNTRMMENLEKFGDTARTRFGGFHFPDAAVSLHACGEQKTGDLSQWESTLSLLHKQFQQGLNSPSIPPQDAAILQQLWEALMRAVDQTVRTGRSDLGAALVCRGGKWTAVAGVYLAGAAKLDAPFRRLAATLGNKNADIQIRLDAEQLADLTLHTLSFPIDPSSPLAELCGARLNTAVGLRPDIVYLAFGNQPLAVVKEAAAQSALAMSRPMPPLDLRLSLGRLAELVAAASPEPIQSETRKIAAQEQAGSGKDHVIMTLDQNARSLRSRITAEEGVLRVLATAWADAIPR